MVAASPLPRNLPQTEEIPRNFSGLGDDGRARLARIAEHLKEAGLHGQVRVGVPTLPRTNLPPTPAEEGIPPLDALLRPLERTPQGRLIELVGQPSSGRTALAYRLAAGATARGELVGWIDHANALDPRFLRRTGLDLDRLLWVRPERLEAALRSAELLLKTGFAVVVLDLGTHHLRSRGRGAHSVLGAAVWARLLRAVQSTRSSAVLLSDERLSGSYATLGLETQRTHARFEQGLFEGLECSAAVVRNRAGPTDAELDFQLRHRPLPPSSLTQRS